MLKMMTMMMTTPWIMRQRREMIRYDLFLERIMKRFALFFCTVSDAKIFIYIHVEKIISQTLYDLE